MPVHGSPVPFGVELLQLQRGGHLPPRPAPVVTSAFRRGASSAALDRRAKVLRESFGSPVPFGVELLQLYSYNSYNIRCDHRVTSAFRRGASSAVLDVLAEMGSDPARHQCLSAWSFFSCALAVLAIANYILLSPVPFGVELLQL